MSILKSSYLNGWGDFYVNMSNEEKLKKIIEKAKDGGYDKIFVDTESWVIEKDFVVSSDLVFRHYVNRDEKINYEAIIFSKPFLKAFFGEERVCELCGKKTKNNCYCNGSPAAVIKEWQYQAQKLVLEDNKIDYLYKFI